MHSSTAATDLHLKLRYIKEIITKFDRGHKQRLLKCKCAYNLAPWQYLPNMNTEENQTNWVNLIAKKQTIVWKMFIVYYL